MFSEETVCSVTQEEFLPNPFNKERFIGFIGEILFGAGCKVICADEDADLDITKIVSENHQKLILLS